MKKSLICLLCSLFAFGGMEASVDVKDQSGDAASEVGSSLESDGRFHVYGGLGVGYLRRSNSVNWENVFWHNAWWPPRAGQAVLHREAPMDSHADQEIVDFKTGTVEFSLFLGMRVHVAGAFSVLPELSVAFGQNKTKKSEKKFEATGGAGRGTYLSKIKDKGTSLACRILLSWKISPCINLYFGPGMRFSKKDYEVSIKGHSVGTQGSWNSNQFTLTGGAEFFPSCSKNLSFRFDYEHAFRSSKKIEFDAAFQRNGGTPLRGQYNFKDQTSGDRFTISGLYTL